MNNFTLSDLERRLARLISYGTVEHLDEQSAKARVRCGAIVTDWLRLTTTRAGPDRTWWAPEIGEQVILLAPSGELNQAVILGSINSDWHPSPANRKTLHRIQYQDGTQKDYDRQNSTDTARYSDGTVIQYSATAHAYTITTAVGTAITVNAGTGDVSADIAGSLTATAAGQASVAAPIINLTGNVTITGSLTLAGPLSAGPGANGGGVSVNGGMSVTGGDVTADGISLKSHKHSGDSGGSTGSPQ